MQSANSHNQLSLAIALLLLAVVACACPNTNDNHQRSQSTVSPSASPTLNVKCSEYEHLTYRSNYDEVIKAIGRPDSESSKGPPEAVIPNIFMYYKPCSYVVISIYGQNPKNGKFNKSTTRYVGTKSTDSGRTLHVSQERFRELIDALPVTP